MRRAAAVVLLLCASAAWADTASLAKDLGDTDEQRAVDAAAALGKTNDPKALEALVAALDAGTTPKAAVALCAALGGKKDARAIPVLVQYAHHRAPEVRKAALAALAIDQRQAVDGGAGGGARRFGCRGARGGGQGDRRSARQARARSGSSS